MQQIQSRQNKNFKIWLACLESKGVQTHHLAILAGKKVIQDTLKMHSDRVGAYLVPENFKMAGFKEEQDALLCAPEASGFELSQKLFKELDIFGTNHPLLVVKVSEIKKLTDKMPGIFLFIPFQDPKNVGAVLRSAAAFGVNKIILAKSASHPFHPESLRAASGCVFDHHFYKAELNDLNNYTTVALDMTGVNINNFKFPQNFILVPGIEGAGLDKNFKSTHKIHIPISENTESLNAMVATSIALFKCQS